MSTFLSSVRRVPPHFSIPPESAEVMPGGAVNLTCVAVGSPMPYVKWRLGAVELTPEENIPIGKNVLMLTDIRESANYTCVAASDLGNIEAIAQVKVKGILGSDTNVMSYTCYDVHVTSLMTSYTRSQWAGRLNDDSTFPNSPSKLLETRNVLNKPCDI